MELLTKVGIATNIFCMQKPKAEQWTSGQAYERFMGRWSPRVAAKFISWMDAPRGQDWLDVGCGSGALSRTIFALAAPASVLGIDPSDKFISYARQRLNDARMRFEMGSAEDLPVEPASFDVAVSGLVLNFLTKPAAALAEMKRALREHGLIGAYVWDYAEGMQMLRHFWDAAIASDPGAKEKDEGRRFPLCHPEELARLFEAAGLNQVETSAIEIKMEFENFDDYWQPFFGVQGPAPGYLARLAPAQRAALEQELRRRLPVRTDGSLELGARAWTVKGFK